MLGAWFLWTVAVAAEFPSVTLRSAERACGMHEVPDDIPGATAVSLLATETHLMLAGHTPDAAWVAQVDAETGQGRAQVLAFDFARRGYARDPLAVERGVSVRVHFTGPVRDVSWTRVVHIDETGEVLGSQVVSRPFDPDRPFSVITGAIPWEGGTAVFGRSGRHHESAKPWLTRQDALGQVLWERSLPKVGTLYDAVVDDEGLVLVGLDTGTREVVVWLLAVGMDGSTRWEATLGELRGPRNPSLTAAPEGFWLTLSADSGPKRRSSTVARLDERGSIVWREPSGRIALSNAAALPGGDLMTLGKGDGGLFITRYDAAGDTVWARSFTRDPVAGRSAISVSPSGEVWLMIPYSDRGSGNRARLLCLTAEGQCCSGAVLSTE